MRRVAAIVTLLCALAVGSAVLGSPARSADAYRIDAIFDTAKGVIPGQLLKIAGAKAGLVEDVTLTPDYKARIQMTVERRFVPFLSDASCSIQPEGLISENFVQCDPGKDGEPLRPQGDLAPTVPVENTSVPVNLTDLFRIFNAPIRERFSILVGALGNSVAARGGDLNEVLRRANPALADVRRVTAILERQRADLAKAVRATDVVIDELAGRRERVTDFVEQADRVTAQTADHRGELAEGIRRLPGLLDQVDPALSRVTTLAREGRPLLADLRAAAPELDRAVAGLAPFAAAGRPALRSLGRAADQGRTTVKSATPVVAQLKRFAGLALPTGRLVDELVVSLRDRGFVEGLLSFVYYVTATTARFDAVSHIAPSELIFNTCSTYAEEPVAACSARYSEAATQRRERARPRRERPARRPKPQVRAPDVEIPKPPELPELPVVPGPLQDLLDEVLQSPAIDLPDLGLDPALEDLTDYLLGR